MVEQVCRLRGMAGLCSSKPCVLALEDGTVFRGASFGGRGTRTGEVVFNTSMTGYQEILTDPSYCGQIVTMTYPQIGNYGTNPEDVESFRPFVQGFVVREAARRYSNYRATISLDDYLAGHGIVGIRGVDTRSLVKQIRIAGAMRGVVTTEIDDPAECVRLAAASPSMVGADLVRVVAPRDSTTWSPDVPVGASGAASGGRRTFQVVAIDCGMKRNILRCLAHAGMAIRIVPPTATAAEVLSYGPDGVFVSNGPGDPAAVDYAINLLRGLIGAVPIFGICLGQQLLGLALGAETFKMKFGHRGANHPVRCLATGRLEITSQNHGFAIRTASLEAVGGVLTHVNLNDGTLEGFVHRDFPLLAIQYHPEAGPGPRDAAYLFECFASMMSNRRALTSDDLAEVQAAYHRRGVEGALGLDSTCDFRRR